MASLELASGKVRTSPFASIFMYYNTCFKGKVST